LGVQSEAALSLADGRDAVVADPEGFGCVGHDRGLRSVNGCPVRENGLRFERRSLGYRANTSLYGNGVKKQARCCPTSPLFLVLIPLPKLPYPQRVVKPQSPSIGYTVAPLHSVLPNPLYSSRVLDQTHRDCPKRPRGIEPLFE
jgi:hypothetical protein